MTRNLVPGESVYGEKRLVAESADGEDKRPGWALENATETLRLATRIEYRVWNPFRSKLGAGIVGGIGACPVKPGAKVLYLGGASGTTVSHVSDMVGPEGRAKQAKKPWEPPEIRLETTCSEAFQGQSGLGVVYAVEFSHRSGRDLTNMAKRRPNVVPIVEDARQPQRYRPTALGLGP